MIENTHEETADKNQVAKIAVSGSRPKWHEPKLTQYGIADHTTITNCGSGNDGVICQSAS